MALFPDAMAAGPIDLRRWQPGDVPAVVDAVSASAAELSEWMPWAQEPATIDAYRSVLATFDAAFDAGTELVLGMFERPGSAVVGGCGLHFRRGPGVTEIGYWVRTDRHRRGYATAAARALTGAAFGFLHDINEIHILVDEANTASAGIPSKLGYSLTGEEHREVLAPRHTGRVLRWVVTRRDWCAPGMG